jgi:hypothetical protein
VSELNADKSSDLSGNSAGAGPVVPTALDATPGEPMRDAPKDSLSVEAPKIAPEQGAADKAKDTPKADAAKPDTKAEAPKLPGTVMIMSGPRDQAWNGDGVDPKAQSAGSKPGIFGKRRVAALAAVIALAAIAGALGGALATAGLGHFNNTETKVANTRALEDTISRIDTEVAALRTSFEQASKHNAAQIGKTSDRIDKVEKAQIEPVAKLAKLSEAVDKLRLASAAPALTPVAAPASAPVAAAPAAPKETTASIQTANAAPVPLPAPKPEVARLPTVEGWVLRDVANGVALIEGRQGIFEVYAGDPIPGLGRIDAIRKQDGRWVVVTSKGLIVAR